MTLDLRPVSKLDLQPVQKEDVPQVDPQVQNKLIASSYLADEMGLDTNVVNASWDKITKERYGKVMTPDAVFDDLEKRGIVATPKAERGFLEMDIEEALSGKQPSEEELRARDRRKLVRSTADYFSYLDKSEEFVGITREGKLLPFPIPIVVPGKQKPVSVQDIIDSKPSHPNVVFSEEEYTNEDLLDISTFTALLKNTNSKEQAQSLYDERRRIVQEHKSQILREQEDAIMRMEASRADSNAFFELFKAGDRGINHVKRGMMSFSVWAGMGWNEQSVLDAEEALNRAEIQKSDAAGKLGYVANVVGETLPYFAVMAVGGWGATFMTEFGNAYADNTESSETMRTLEATAIALPVTLIESMQLDKWFKFAQAGRTSFVSFRRALQDRMYKEIMKNGMRMVGQSATLALNEGIEELLQEGVQLSVPAILRGEYPKTPDGKTDWSAILDRSLGAFTGGSIGGLFLGGFGRGINAYQSTKGKKALAASIAVYEGMDYELAYEKANEIFERKDEGLPFPELYQKVVNPELYAQLKQQASESVQREAESATDSKAPVQKQKGTPEGDNKTASQEGVQGAIRLKDGSMITVPMDEFISHADIAIQNNLDIDQIESGGFIVDGNYNTQTNPTDRQERVDLIKKKVASQSISQEKTGQELKETAIIDKSGNPAIVFHGTSKQFDEISLKKGPDGTAGIYFTNSKEYANDYADGFSSFTGREPNSDARIIEAYIDIKNPKQVLIKNSDYLTENEVEDLKSQGYDGLVVTPNAKMGEPITVDDMEEIIPFDASQIKIINKATNKIVEPQKELSDKQPETSPRKPIGEDTEPEVPQAVIEDFGEKIGGARKDYYATLEKAKELDIATNPLSKTFPVPDYQKLIDAGTDPFIVGMVRSMRDEIPNKPQKGYKLKKWVQQVELLRQFSDDLLSGKITKEVVLTKMEEFKSLLGPIKGRAELYEIAGHDVSLKGISFKKVHFGLYRGQENVDKWMIEKKQKNTALSNMPREIAAGDTREEAISQFLERYNQLKTADKKKATVKFDIYSYRKKPGEFWIGKKVGKNTIDLKKFETSDEAVKYRKDKYEDLLKLLEEAKYIPDPRRAANEDRIGPDYRKGEDVTPEMFTQAFGFRGVEFGNWVSKTGERQTALNNAYDALMDLAMILEIPSQAISLDGELGLAFGSRGRGGKNPAAAHYEPDRIVINLTRKNGPGSLAHEWWHALDNFFSRSRNYKSEYLSERPHQLGPENRIRQEMVDAFKNIVDSYKKTDIEKRSMRLDQRRSKPYWAQGREISARLFENYVISKLAEKGYSNDYLSNIQTQTEYMGDMAEHLLAHEGSTAMDVYPYLTQAEEKTVIPAYERFFNTMEVKKTPKGFRPGFIDNTPFGNKDKFFEKMADVAREMNEPSKDTPLQEEINKRDKSPNGMATNNQKARAHIIQNENNISEEKYREIAFESTGKTSTTEMTKIEADRFIRALQGKRKSMGDAFYDKNAGRGKIPLPEKASSIFEQSKTIVAKAVGTMSDRLRRISPTLFQKVKRDFIFKSQHRTAEMAERVRPFVEGIEKASKEDQQKLELASLIGEPATDDILEIINKYGLQEAYQSYRDVMDQLYTMAYSVGMNIDYTPMYFPRKIRDFKGLMKYLHRTEYYSVIETALRNRSESAGRELTDEEKAAVIGTLLRGYRISQVSLATPGNAKPREIAIIDKNIAPYYHGWKRSLIDYIHEMNTNIAARQFFGKESSDVAKLRGQISRARNRVYQYENGLVKAKDPKKLEDGKQRAINRLKDLEAAFSQKNINFLKDSIGAVVLQEREAGRITADQERELKGIYEAIFSPKGPGRAVQQIMKWGYVSTLSQLTNALTQAGELVYSELEDPIRANINYARAWADKSNIKLNDITGGLGNVQEWTDAGLDNLAKKLLLAVTKVNDVGFETFVNTVIEKRRSQARKNPDKFKNEIEYVYGPETDELVADLISGQLTDNVKYLAFAELSELQPISIMEMPEMYARAGNWRIFYMLKTFTIKRLNILYNQATKDLKSKDPSKVLRGLSRAAWMAFWLLMADTTIDTLKDFLRGRPTDVADNVIDNLFQSLMLSKYDLARLTSEGVGGTVANMLVPPTAFGDAILKDMATLSDEDSEKGSELARRIPYIGEFYYWWFGEGARKVEEGYYDE